MQAGFQDVRRDLHVDFRKIGERLLDAINGIEVRRPEFDAFKNDVEDFSGLIYFFGK